MASASAPGGSWSVAASAMSGGLRLTGRHPYHGRRAREYRRRHGREEHDGGAARRVPGGGGPAHVARLRALGATRQEVLEALLMTLPAAGFGPLSQCLPAAMAVFDA